MNPTLLVSFALACSAVASAQVSETWRTVIPNPPGASGTGARWIVPLDDGGVAVAGWRDIGAGSALRDTFVARLDAAGGVVWHTADVTPPRDEAHGIALDRTDGSLIVLGSTGWSTVPHLLRVSKYDLTGALVWAATHVGTETGFESPRLRVDAAGNSFVAFTARTSPLDQPENLDIVTESYDRNGVLRWTRTLSGPGLSDDEITDAAVAPNGDLIVTGFTNGAYVSTSFRADPWIVAIDPAGQVRWSHAPSGSGPGFNMYRSPLIDASGRIYVQGTDAAALPNPRIELDVYDATGNLLSTTTLPRGYADYALDPAGSIYAAVGTFSPIGWLAKFTPSGALAWEVSWSNPAGTSVYFDHLIADPSGDVTVIGRSATPGQVNNPTHLALRYAPDASLRWQHQIPPQTGQQYGIVGATVSDSGATTICGYRFTNHLQALVMRLDTQSTSICIGDGIASPCPCGNVSAIGAQSGCSNSAGLGARLTDSGDASVANDTLVVSVAGEPSDAPTVVIQGTASANSAAFGDGLRCAGGSVLRMYTRPASAGALQVPGPGDPSVTARSAALGTPISAGSMRVYQSYYRDPDPAFCPSPAGSTWNLSNGLLVRWGT